MGSNDVVGVGFDTECCKCVAEPQSVWIVQFHLSLSLELLMFGFAYLFLLQPVVICEVLR